MKWIFTLLIVASIQPVFAWGPEGHMIVAEIAERRLTPAASAAVKKLLPNDSLSDVANWADVVKNKPDWIQTKDWHFVNIADGDTYETSQHNANGDCVIAINQMVQILTTKSGNGKIAKEDALRFLVHFMGDIHMPLHAGRLSDRGGNDIKVMYEGRSTNLHQLWDSGMITDQKMDFPQYADFLIAHNTAVNSPASGVPFKQIISEDMAVRSMIYDFTSLLDANISLDRNYEDRNLATLNQQLLSGGIRLADILNSIFK